MGLFAMVTRGSVKVVLFALVMTCLKFYGLLWELFVLLWFGKNKCLLGQGQF